MPLIDHFTHLTEDYPSWTSLLSSWAVHLASRLNQLWLPQEFVAYNAIKIGNEIESPLKSYDPSSVGVAPEDPGEPPIRRPNWDVPAPQWSVPRTRGDHIEVHVHDEAQRWTDRSAVVAFVTPTNKESLQQRRAFLYRCATHLYEGASLAVIDVITCFPSCLFNDLLTLLGTEGVPHLPPGTRLFAAAFRPVSRGDRRRVIDPNERLETDIWLAPVTIGESLPTLPLRLIYDLYVPVEFEAIYMETCRRLRIV